MIVCFYVNRNHNTVKFLYPYSFGEGKHMTFIVVWDKKVDKIEDLKMFISLDSTKCIHDYLYPNCIQL